jgi:phasin family protein
MFEEMFQKTNVQFGELFAPARKFNALVVDNLEKVTKFQLEALRSYADLGIEQLRGALEVNDAQSLQAYVSNQQKVAETVSKKLSSDAETFAALSKDFTVEVQKLAQENVTSLTQFAQNKAKAAAPKAAPARKTA